MSGVSVGRRSVVKSALLLLLGGLLATGASTAYGQEPTPTSTPAIIAEPSDFGGSVTINGETAPDGTPIEALVGDVVCGTTTTSRGRYDVRINAGYGIGTDVQEGCGSNGVAVLFRTGELTASQQGQFLGGVGQTLDLTFGTSALPNTGSGPISGTGGGGTPIAVAALAAGAIVAGAASWARRGASSM